MRFIIVLISSCLATDYTQIVSGFIQGLRKDNLVESSCYSGFFAISESFEASMNSTSIGSYLHNFQDFTNILVATIDICQFRSLLDQIISTFQPDQMEALELYVLTFLTEFIDLYNLFESASTDYDKGFYGGKIFSKLFGYYI
ncbi:hypothetical protein SteCoe_29366 [Stentor coeruleus]|uniref:Uncharacterized protein n=1 Tax=Stentor coeruleus TaxID=5963 RepID=A0A1R2B631_9CILI|nr:hypothetical protein SteCoe_29366 [Stentor coeruleus]